MVSRRTPGRALRKLLHVATKPMKADHGRGGVVVQAYRGYGSAQEIYVLGRVFRQPGFGQSLAEGSLLRDLVDLLRRTLRWGVGDAQVTLKLNDSKLTVSTGKDGYFDIHMKLDTPLDNEKSWHRATLEVAIEHAKRQPDTIETQAEIYVPPASADLVVISDIDDTVMYTGVANKFKMIYRLFFETAERRTAFPGVATFYQALFEGPDGNRDRPMLYVSRGPWGIYEVLEAFFQRNHIPVGPILFLRDWGMTLQNPLPRQAVDHKRKLIEQMLALYDDLPFVLIGDSGQHDPEVYVQIVEQYPGRIRAIYIRNINHDESRDAAIARLADQVAKNDCELLLAKSSQQMASHASELGLIAPESVERVRARSYKEAQRPI